MGKPFFFVMRASGDSRTIQPIKEVHELWAIIVIKKREENAGDQLSETINLTTTPKRAVNVVKDWVIEWRNSKETQNNVLLKTWRVAESSETRGIRQLHSSKFTRKDLKIAKSRRGSRDFIGAVFGTILLPQPSGSDRRGQPNRRLL
jgi:HJR/Mrr/RecB family endonuclease